MKYVLVTGGVVSGLGKGVTASSIGLLLQACGLRVTSIKIGTFIFKSFLSWFWFKYANFNTFWWVYKTKLQRFFFVVLRLMSF